MRYPWRYYLSQNSVKRQTLLVIRRNFVVTTQQEILWTFEKSNITNIIHLTSISSVFILRPTSVTTVSELLHIKSSVPRLDLGRAIAQGISRWLPTAVARIKACGICGGQSGDGAGFSEYFGFACQSSFHQFLHNYHHLSSGAGTIGQ
jgi:hypothetical protein